MHVFCINMSNIFFYIVNVFLYWYFLKLWDSVQVWRDCEHRYKCAVKVNLTFLVQVFGSISSTGRKEDCTFSQTVSVYWRTLRSNLKALPLQWLCEEAAGLHTSQHPRHPSSGQHTNPNSQTKDGSSFAKEICRYVYFRAVTQSVLFTVS